ncbi:M48 family metalloprotease [Actinokineospora sp. UTMC 2448]|uniref:M48 family metalloprotease n=1 Tax=Actinokineospora sp. UTMC 2448 TaxID=2268449 RepID=UPI00216419A2|nr:M48 family metalloprotease [Actinokineospora sp. UTMC 2448]UVS82225.1 Protease HtpX [Actinokineospora sp. UTMC 2448]
MRTALLLSGISALLLLVGALFDAVWLALAAAALLVAYALGAADRIALRAMRARPVSQAEHPRLYAIVRELATTSRKPMPRLYVSATAAPNAFAVGRGPRSAAVCCTTGLLDLLDDRELRAVLAHEVAHVHRRDTLVASVAGALAGIIAVVGGAAALVGGDDDDDGLWGALAVAVLGPVAALVVRLAISRSREFRADADAVRLTGDADALVAALRKLDAGTRAAPLAPAPALVAQAHLMVVNPFPADSALARRFATHPPIDERVSRLRPRPAPRS